MLRNCRTLQVFDKSLWSEHWVRHRCTYMYFCRQAFVIWEALKTTKHKSASIPACSETIEPYQYLTNLFDPIIGVEIYTFICFCFFVARKLLNPEAPETFKHKSANVPKCCETIEPYQSVYDKYLWSKHWIQNLRISMHICRQKLIIWEALKTTKYKSADIPTCRETI